MHLLQFSFLASLTEMLKRKPKQRRAASSRLGQIEQLEDRQLLTIYTPAIALLEAELLINQFATSKVTQATTNIRTIFDANGGVAADTLADYLRDNSLAAATLLSSAINSFPGEFLTVSNSVEAAVRGIDNSIGSAFPSVTWVAFNLPGGQTTEFTDPFATVPSYWTTVGNGWGTDCQSKGHFGNPRCSRR